MQAEDKPASATAPRPAAAAISHPNPNTADHTSTSAMPTAKAAAGSQLAARKRSKGSTGAPARSMPASTAAAATKPAAAAAALLYPVVSDANVAAVRGGKHHPQPAQPGKPSGRAAAHGRGQATPPTARPAEAHATADGMVHPNFCFEPASSSTPHLHSLARAAETSLTNRTCQHKIAPQLQPIRRQRPHAVLSALTSLEPHHADADAVAAEAHPLSERFASFGGYRQGGLRERMGHRRTTRSCLQRPRKLGSAVEPRQSRSSGRTRAETLLFIRTLCSDWNLAVSVQAYAHGCKSRPLLKSLVGNWHAA